MQETSMEMTELPKPEAVEQQKMNTQSQTSVEATPASGSCKQIKKQHNLDIQNQRHQTALLKLARKNQKQLVGENFERINYLYQCSTRLARLTTPVKGVCTCPAAPTQTPPPPAAPTQTTPPGPATQTETQASLGRGANSAPISSVPDRVSRSAAIYTRNVAALNRISSDDCALTVDKCSSSTPDVLSTHLGLDTVSDDGMTLHSSEVISQGCSTSLSTACGSHSDHAPLCSEDHPPSSTNTSSNNSSQCDSDLVYNNNPTTSSSGIVSIANSSQPDTVIDTISAPDSSCSEMEYSYSNPTVPSLKDASSSVSPSSKFNPHSIALEQSSHSNYAPPPAEPSFDSHSCPAEPSSDSDSTLTETWSEVGGYTNRSSSCLELASNLSSTCRAVGRKCQLRLSHHMKRELCRGCSTPLVPAVTASAKVIKVRKKRVLAVRCLTCGVRRTRPCQHVKTLWADRCAVPI